MKNLALSIFLVSLVAACTTPAEKPKEPPPKTEPTTTTPTTPVAVDPLDDPNSILAKRSVYYPLDVAVVQTADRPLVEAHAKYLAEHSNVKVRLEGNCDERGSNEYNLALGQRRADGVKKLLIAGGASAGQIESVSNGEEKPRETCHEEKCWKENRRTDLMYNR